jgi:hypothetical protein
LAQVSEICPSQARKGYFSPYGQNGPWAIIKKARKKFFSTDSKKGFCLNNPWLNALNLFCKIELFVIVSRFPSETTSFGL